MRRKEMPERLNQFEVPDNTITRDCGRATYETAKTGKGAPWERIAWVLKRPGWVLYMSFVARDQQTDTPTVQGPWLYLLRFDRNHSEGDPVNGEVAHETFGPVSSGGPVPAGTLVWSEAITDLHTADGGGRPDFAGMPCDEGCCFVVSLTPRILTLPQLTSQGAFYARVQK